MNLYLISQSTNNNYDTYDSAVVVAKDIIQAVSIHPNGDTEWDGAGELSDGDWTDKENVSASLVGASNERKPRVVLSSFNAG